MVDVMVRGERREPAKGRNRGSLWFWEGASEGGAEAINRGSDRPFLPPLSSSSHPCSFSSDQQAGKTRR